MSMKKFSSLMAFAHMLLFVMVFGIAGMAQAQEAAPEATPAVAAATGAVVSNAEISTSMKYLAIGIIMAGGSLAAAWAVGKVGAAAMGAAAEKPELLGKAIAFVGLGEGIALFGFLVALFMLNK